MNTSTDILRRALIVGSTISLLVVIASCIGLAASFVKPALDLHELYRISSVARTASFWFLGSYLVAGFAIPNPPAAGMRAKKTSSWEQRVLMIIGIVCFLLIMFSPHTYVYPEAGGWVTKSKAGTFSISSDVAREYLWRGARVSSAIPLCLSLSVIAFSRKFARQVLRPTTGGPDAIP
jgi:uncharacterized membrane protein